LLGVEELLGTIAPGKLADLVVIDGDAGELEKLSERVSGVWKDGSRLI
jgi:imidazolonepropionase-like amidohydrolase